MRVLYINHSCVLRVNQTRLVELAKLPNIEVALLAPTQWRERNIGATYTFQQPKENSFKAYSIKTYLNFHPIFYFYEPFRISQIIKEFKPDLVHIEQEPFSLSAFQLVRAGKRQGVKLVMTTYQNLDKKYFPPFSLIESYNLRSINHLIAGTEQIKRLWQRRSGREDISVIPLGYNPAKFHPQRCQTLRNSLNLKSFVIGYLGRLIEAKGLATLLQATAILKEKFTLLIDNQGPFKKRMVELAQTLGLGEKLVFIEPSHEEVPDYINCMDVLVLPSFTTSRWTEQFGRVLIEAMACGVPVIGSSSGAIPWVIGDAGLIFQERNPGDLAHQLERVINDTTLRQNLKKKGTERALAKFTWKKIAQKMHTVYEKCLRE